MSAQDHPDSGTSKSPIMKQEEMKQKFCRLHQKANELGLKDEDFQCLTALKEITKASKTSRGIVPLLWKSFKITLCVCFAFLLMWCLDWPIKNEQMLSMYFRVQGYTEEDIFREPCVVDNVELFDMFRPPVPCGFCKGIHDVERVAKISPGEFESRFAYSGRPVVITDAMQNWTAVKLFNFKFFKGIYKEGSPVLTNVDSNCQFFPYKTTFNNLKEVFEMDESRANMKDGFQPWYIGWSNCDSSAGNILRKHYNRPYFLPPIAESSKTDWVFMGSPGYGAHLHIDNVGNPSWQAQVSGTKMWTLEPPPECYMECGSQMKVTVNPGDIIVLDTNKWYHSTQNVGKDLSICIGSEYD